VRLELRLFGLVALAIQPLGSSVQAQAQASLESFTVGDIRVEGLQRISEGTVFNYLPVNIGDHLDGQRIGEAMRALYATGFFRDVELRRDGNTLLVVVIERPSIAKFELKGNKDIKTEDLQKSLRNVGLATGKTFDRSVLDEVKQYLTDQYFSRGKYAVRVDTKITDLPGNKVDVIVDRTDQPGRQHQIQGKGHPRQLRIEDAELAVMVQAGRSIFARVPDRGLGETAFLLHGSRLRELPDRVDAGRHSA
jgi:outer membrane protein assembly factor BamA